MLIISFDAVGDDEFERLLQYPAFNAFSRQCAVFRDVSSVFLSNTYPIHTSVATGVLPREHGIFSNTETFPVRKPVWNCDERLIRAKTIWQLAAKKGIKTAAVLWPVTAYSKTIRYNVPEIIPRPGENQVMTSLKAGSTLLQLKLFLRYKKLLDGFNQPNLDNFSTACMTDILREKKPGLALVHFTAYDSICHYNGKGSSAMETAFQALDKNLAALLKVAVNDDVILFSDHSQINIHTVVDPNLILVSEGLIHKTDDGYLPGEKGCYFENLGGSAVFHSGKLDAGCIERIRLNISKSEGFNRFLTTEEMNTSGLAGASFGFCAKTGFCYEIFGTKKKGQHGFPLDMPDYRVFYMARGCGLEPGSVVRGGSLLDIAPLVKKRLGL